MTFQTTVKTVCLIFALYIECSCSFPVDVHRVGRTGRAGKKGTSFTYFTTENARSARELISILREAKSVVPPELEEMAMLGGGGGKSRSS